jgi:hypothetical protein
MLTLRSQDLKDPLQPSVNAIVGLSKVRLRAATVRTGIVHEYSLRGAKSRMTARERTNATRKHLWRVIVSVALSG